MRLNFEKNLDTREPIKTIFDSSNAVLGMAFTHTHPPRKGDSVLYGRDELCTA